MKLVVPISYFKGSPRSELWQLDLVARQYQCLLRLPDSPWPVEGKGITGLVALKDNSYLACDFNRLLKLDPQGQPISTTALRDFNDLHALTSCKNGILVANTGRDSVELYDYDLQPLRRWDALTTNQTAERLEGLYAISGSYYDEPTALPFRQRKCPDSLHLNHALMLPNGRVLATSFKRQCLVDIETWQPASNILPFMPHDGSLFRNRVWLTTVNGQLFSAPLPSHPDEPLQFRLTLDLFAQAPHHGWCRGLLFSNGKLFVGITAIQEPSERTSWLTQPIDMTRSGVYQLSTTDFSLEHFFDLSCKDGARVFSIVESLQC